MEHSLIDLSSLSAGAKRTLQLFSLGPHLNRMHILGQCLVEEASYDFYKIELSVNYYTF